MNKNYCIIGTGVAAVNAAKEIRVHDKEANILLFGAEKSLPYNRIKLSKELFSDLSSEKVLIKKKKWYQDHNIHTLSNTKVDKIDIDNRAIITSTGETIHYDKLLICTGAKNRKLPINGVDKKGVFTIREMHEAEDFKAFIEDKTSIVNIGGGIQGIETAWSIYMAGKKVSIVEVAPRLMSRQLDEKTSTLLKNKIEEAGVDIYLNTSIKQIIGENEVEGIIVGDQTIPCDSVIYSIGVVPNIFLTENTLINTNRGIVVNERMETNVEDVYAAGDVTELNGEVEGLWGRAMDQGKAAGKNMASASELYQKTTPFTVFNAFNLALFSIGLIDESHCDTTIIEEDGDEKYTRVFIKDHKIIGAISLEGIAASTPYKTAIESQVSLVGLDLKNISIRALMSEVKDRLVVSH
ncbi:NAD(P)/FAD-dependent oxidoreductase [Neobacillus massiliamazoniensis]|uniref:Nitrite reductase [NAD(P)H] large subunit n=1 Tax=Neobacillus massiliamazoniensis TaxID=1499688 RepID=A0A0U1NXX4_9BACI|nr:FAD-dependent oxidoreductase [Neobacillus massiliamazoniensis]CRK82867.1 nitrite reductase [NAD(P)H] large subunit [Neobacillus massiliamazoniensis]